MSLSDRWEDGSNAEDVRTVSSPIRKKPKKAVVQTARSMIVSGSILSRDHTRLIWWRIVGVIGRRGFPLVVAGCFAFALVMPFMTTLSFGIVECWGSGKPSATCLWRSADRYTLMVPIDKP